MQIQLSPTPEQIEATIIRACKQVSTIELHVMHLKVHWWQLVEVFNTMPSALPSALLEERPTVKVMDHEDNWLKRLYRDMASFVDGACVEADGLVQAYMNVPLLCADAMNELNQFLARLTEPPADDENPRGNFPTLDEYHARIADYRAEITRIRQVSPDVVVLSMLQVLCCSNHLFLFEGMLG